MKVFVKVLVLSVLMVSSVMADNVSAYLYANYKNSDTVYSTLKARGFEILGEYDVQENEDYHILIFTNPVLKKAASHPDRGFASVLKVLVSKKKHQLIFTNPEYFLHAFLQDQYNEKSAEAIVDTLSAAFGNLSYSKAALDKSDIEEYHFLMGMPYYDDMIVLAEGNNLLSRVKKQAGDAIVFSLSLRHATLVGIDMLGAMGDKEFLSKIKGEEHASFLPYMILIEDNKAKILHPKYYIAISYPELTMSEFINISSAPEDITNHLRALVK